MAKEESQDGKFYDYFFTVWHEVPDGEKSILRKQGYQEIRARSLEEAARISEQKPIGCRTEEDTPDKPKPFRNPSVICMDKIVYPDKVDFAETVYDGSGSALCSSTRLTLRRTAD